MDPAVLASVSRVGGEIGAGRLAGTPGLGPRAVEKVAIFIGATAEWRPRLDCTTNRHPRWRDPCSHCEGCGIV